MDTIQNSVERVGAAVRGSLSSPRHILAVTGISVVITVLFLLSTFPQYTVQMVTADIGLLDNAFLALGQNFIATAGVFGVVTLVTYALLTAIAVVHIAIQVQVSGVGIGVGTAGASSPALLVGGCAACGPGILGLLGFAGAVSLLPFQGNGVRLLGIAVLLVFLSYAGDPQTCAVDR